MSIKDIIGQRIASASVVFAHNHFGIRSFELEVRDADGKRLGTQIIPMDFLKAEGITYTLNGKRQVEEWANSEKGLGWLRDNYGTDAKHIAQLKGRVRGELERRKLPSLTVKEVNDHLRKGVRVFHNGGVRWRIVVGSGAMIAYKTKPSSPATSAVWAHDFAKWCKGVVLPDGTIWTKGEAASAESDAGSSEDQSSNEAATSVRETAG